MQVARFFIGAELFFKVHYRALHASHAFSWENFFCWMRKGGWGRIGCLVLITNAKLARAGRAL